jgi:hypothetical protein
MLWLCACAVAAIAQPDPVAPGQARSIQIESPTSGSLAGRITDLHSAPLANLSLMLRNQSTGAEFRGTTTRNGSFRFPLLAVGEYTLEADEPRLGHGHLEGIVVTGGIESRVQAAIRLEPAPLLAAAAPDRVPGLGVSPPRAQAPAKPPVLSALTAPAPLQPVSAPGPAVIAAGDLPMRQQAWRAPSRPLPLPSVDSSRQLQNAAAAPAAAPSNWPRPKIDSPDSHAGRAALETESAGAESMLAFSVPRNFSFSPRTEIRLLAGSAAVGAVRAAVLHNPARLGPIVKAAQTPDPAAPAVETTLTAAQLQTLPVRGRRWQEFLLDTPAATASPDAVQPAFRAASFQSAGIVVDGASARLAFGVAAGSSAAAQAELSGSESSQQNSASQGWAGA